MKQYELIKLAELTRHRSTIKETVEAGRVRSSAPPRCWVGYHQPAALGVTGDYLPRFPSHKRFGRFSGWPLDSAMTILSYESTHSRSSSEFVNPEVPADAGL